AGKAVTYSAWTDLMTAKNADDQFRIAESEAETPVAPWALLHAAAGRYQEGFEDLPTNKEAALPLLNRAYEMFDQAYREANPELQDDLRQLAAIGMARTLEARNELDKAIKQYDEVAKQWPDSATGAQARALAEQLRKSENVEFYSKLYAFKPREVELPPGGSFPLDPSSGFPLDALGLPSNHPALNSPTMPAGALPSLPGLPDLPRLPSSSPPKTGGGELPGGIFENNPPPAPSPEPKATTPEVETPKAETSKDVPALPFAK
ncbi:MAG: hypothetical protein ABI353_21230, partial [Isosphaeraceae bacterium]